MNNTNALYDASRRNNIEEVKRLIADGDTNVNPEKSPIGVAAADGNTDIVEILIDAGIDLNQGDKSSFTPLSLAILNRRTEIAKMLIDAGADVNKANSEGRTPLFWARKEGNTEIIDLLLENGAIASGIRKKTKARKSKRKTRKSNKKSRKSYRRR